MRPARRRSVAGPDGLCSLRAMPYSSGREELARTAISTHVRTQREGGRLPVIDVTRKRIAEQEQTIISQRI